MVVMTVGTLKTRADFASACALFTMESIGSERVEKAYWGWKSISSSTLFSGVSWS
jgi:hypothetical protein